MSKIVQRGASAALRMRQMSNIAADTSKFTPEQMAEMGRRINPAQQVFGPKDPKIEELQRFFQDPINARIPMYKRKGYSDFVLYSMTAGSVAFIFLGNIYTFATGQ